MEKPESSKELLSNTKWRALVWVKASKEGLFENVDEWWQNPSNCLIGSVKFNIEAGVQWMGVGCGETFGDFPRHRGGRGPFHSGLACGSYYGGGYGYGGRDRGIWHGKSCQLASCWNRVQLVDQTVPRDCMNVPTKLKIGL
ncbi:hypothetical protein V6N13_068777 [Hibiscus sabdariffa]